jgi:hypothetical protein
MTRIENLTLTRLLDYVEAHAARMAVGRQSIPARAFMAGADGTVTVFSFPPPDGDDARRALMAILQSEIWKRRATLFVVLTETQAKPPDGNQAAECILLEGQQVRPLKAEARVLAIERKGRKITKLKRLRPWAGIMQMPLTARAN